MLPPASASSWAVIFGMLFALLAGYVAQLHRRPSALIAAWGAGTLVAVTAIVVMIRNGVAWPRWRALLFMAPGSAWSADRPMCCRRARTADRTTNNDERRTRAAQHGVSVGIGVERRRWRRLRQLSPRTPTSSTSSAATTPDGKRFDASHRMIFGTIYKGSTVALQRAEDQVSAAGYRAGFSAAALELAEGAQVSEVDARPTIVAEKHR